MSWFADLAGKAEDLLNNIDEQTGAALRSHTGKVHKFDGNGAPVLEQTLLQKSTKRFTRSPVRRPVNIPEIRSTSPPKRFAPPSRIPLNNTRPIECVKELPTRLRRSPTRKGNVTNYNLNNCPRTLVNDDVEKEKGELFLQDMKKRRFSLPENIQQLLDNENLSIRLENSEVENAMLKNELNIMNKEVSDLIDRLQKTEDESENTVKQADSANNKLTIENNKLNKEILQLQENLDNVVSTEIERLQENNDTLKKDLVKLRQTNNDLEDKLNQLTIQNKSNSTKLESDLRHAQSYINDLQNDLERSKDENHRLEKEWEAYKLRVKSMLNSKDKEIKAFEEGIKFNDESKFLTDQLESLRIERQDLSEEVSKIREESEGLRHYIGQLESKTHSAERLVAALREAMREERAAKNQADTEYLIVKKELKHIKTESTQIIEGLRNRLEHKEVEILSLKQVPSTLPIEHSGLNVADYDVKKELMVKEKMDELARTLVEKQAKIDSLIADKNMLKIHLDKIETKYKNEITQRTHSNHHSIVNVNDTDSRIRNKSRYIPESALSRISLRIGVFMRRNPLFRIFIIFYMVGLHLWVALVLLTYTPEAHSIPKHVS